MGKGRQQSIRGRISFDGVGVIENVKKFTIN